MGLWSTIKSLFIDPRMEADSKVPLRRWTRSAIAIITGGDDYGYFPKDKVSVLLKQMWSIDNTRSAENALRELADGDSAWDLVRALHVTRMAVGADYLDADKGWALLYPVATKIQSRYDSWDALAHDYYEKRVKWAKDTGSEIPSKEEFDSELDVTKSVYWEEIDFKQDLAVPTF